jgi:hypothetical protein
VIDELPYFNAAAGRRRGSDRLQKHRASGPCAGRRITAADPPMSLSLIKGATKFQRELLRQWFFAKVYQHHAATARAEATPPAPARKPRRRKKTARLDQAA